MSDLSFIDDNESLEIVLKQLKANNNLNEREHGFVLDIFEKYYEDGDVFDYQLQILSDLWNKY